MGQLLVVHLGGVVLHAGEDDVPGDVQVQEPVVLTGGRVQAGVVRVGGAATDSLEKPACQQVPVHRQHCFHLAAGIVLESGDQVAVVGVYRGHVLGSRTAHGGELAPYIGRGAVAANERDRVDRAVHVGVPRGNGERGGFGETEDVVPAERLRGRAVVTADLGERAYRVHGSAALCELADRLGGRGVHQRRSPCLGVGRHL